MEPKYYPKISIVTPSFNQGDFIEETINSILNQNYPNLEYIIIDGGSTDNTISILNKYSSYLYFWISEKDNGQSDALNKGFKIATGEICAYINSDDLYLDNIFWEVANHFINKKCLWLSTNVACGYCLEQTTLFEQRISSYPEFCAQQTIGQQGVFWSRSAIEKPWFDSKLRYVMDHKFFIKLYKSCGPPDKINTISSFFRFHPEAKTSKLEAVLMKERKAIGEEAAMNSKNSLEASRIRKEIKRLELKIEGKKLLDKISSNLLYHNKILIFIRIILIIFITPFPLRDKIFAGYIYRSFKRIIPIFSKEK